MAVPLIGGVVAWTSSDRGRSPMYLGVDDLFRTEGTDLLPIGVIVRESHHRAFYDEVWRWPLPSAVMAFLLVKKRRLKAPWTLLTHESFEITIHQLPSLPFDVIFTPLTTLHGLLRRAGVSFRLPVLSHRPC